MILDPVSTAESLVAERFPKALAAFLGGSALTSHRTSTSDLDIVAVLPEPAGAYRETLRYRDWPVELFVHTPASLRQFWHRDAQQHRVSLARMCAEGRVLVSNQGTAEQLQQGAVTWVAAGPPPVAAVQFDLDRYRVTDLLDDLAGSTEPAETAYIAAALLPAAAELLLTHRGAWLDSGKWLARRMAEHDPDLARRIVAGHREAIASGATQGLHQAVLDLLGQVGGPLREGFVLAAEL
jgi:hypothetical protein